MNVTGPPENYRNLSFPFLSSVLPGVRNLIRIKKGKMSYNVNHCPMPRVIVSLQNNECILPEMFLSIQ